MERLDKILASTGRWSRREVKELVRAGRVTVNGLPAQSSEDKADRDTVDIRVDEVPVSVTQYTYLMLNKPAGQIGRAHV